MLKEEEIDLSNLFADKLKALDEKKSLKKVGEDRKSEVKQQPVINYADYYTQTFFAKELRVNFNTFIRKLVSLGYLERQCMLRHPTKKAEGLYLVKPGTDITKPYPIYWKLAILELLKDQTC